MRVRELYELCGGWQNFHDAEILEFLFRPTGNSELKILLEPWRSEERVCGKKIMVVFKFSEFERLDLRDFESQNIIDELQIEKSGDLYTIELHAGDGLGGTITARNLSVECHDIDA